MKITPILETVRFLNRVQEKREGQERRENTPENPSDQKKDASKAEVDAAITSFQEDAATQNHGLTATATGNGPGLRVTLKDQQGKVLRQITGEEFLKLREAASQAPKRGKILDQKF